ncbi:Myb/SANT-like domain-containing protein [Tanacetum coccineum]|uniref:Myb/SANT-like domain-containing protein n=1 Tax=Tanacetum coccineum TaxID=301880 RepID=A0ABQ4ZN12_9ASTR
MATSNATSRKENWTDQSVLTLCNFLIQHQNNNGRNKAYPWSHLQPEYEKIHNHKFNSKQALKSKYDSMRKQYTLWKQLKHGETGLGWNASTGALACSNDWWDRKIKENPNVSCFRTKQPSKELQEAWEQLFGGLLAGGSVVVGLGMDQDTSSEIPNVNLENAEIPNVNHENVEIPNVNHENVEIPNVNLKNVAIDIDDDTEPIQVWNHYSQHLDAKENDFYSSLMRDVGQDVTTPCPDEISRQPNKSKNMTTKPKIVEMKRKGRNSGGTKLFQGYMAKQEEKQERIIKILESDAFGASKDDPYSVSRCMIVINGMVDDALMTDDSPLFYLAMDLFEDAVKRELFMNMRNDSARLKWLQHKQDQGD